MTVGERGSVRLLVAGATGAVGREVLRLALADPRVGQVVAPTRRPLPPAGGLTNIVVDFASLDEAPSWCEVDAVACALGTTIKKAGSREAFAAVDRDLVVDLARCALQAGATRFALTSSVGAGTGRSFYLRTKAEAEEGVRRLGYPSLTIVRPSLLDADRDESRPAEQLALGAAHLLRPLIPRRYRPVSSETVARTLLAGLLEPTPGVTIVESDQLHRPEGPGDFASS